MGKVQGTVSGQITVRGTAEKKLDGIAGLEVDGKLTGDQVNLAGLGCRTGSSLRSGWQRGSCKFPIWACACMAAR